mmetsp:Transcript_23338/g.36515  ORF Transcript_23338/g.36515 Transcript_23338/m.36515 type:complete len:268 (+) Transcript_23338:224-1027(+)
MRIHPGEAVIVGMPGFKMDMSRPELLDPQFQAHWVLATEDMPFNHLVLMVPAGQSHISAHKEVLVRILPGQLRLPKLGSQTNNSAIRIWTNATEGQTPPAPLVFTQGFGSFGGYLTLVFEYSTKSLLFGATAFMPINSGARIRLHLPHFSLQTSLNDATTLNLTYASGGSQEYFGPLSAWTDNEKVLELVVQETLSVESGGNIFVNISGLELGSQGCQIQETMGVELMSDTEPVLFTPFDQVCLRGQASFGTRCCGGTQPCCLFLQR